MTQIRIYYESLEQGANFLKPIVEKVVPRDVEIVLVRRPKKSSDLNEGSISALLTMVTPDGLITGIKDGIEYPLVLVEFTEAVTTEDHELQRTYGSVAAYLAGAYYLKLAGEKLSEKEFGGAEYNPYSTPKIFIDKVGYEGYIIAKWETEKGNAFTLKRNAKYPSCPPDIPVLIDTVQQSVRAFIEDSENWMQRSLVALKKKESYIAYRSLVDKASGADELVESWKGRRDSNLNKLRYFVKEDWIGAKINRFSHSMDPDKGILTFISFLFSEHKKVYGIYALVRPREVSLRNDITSVEAMKERLPMAFAKDKAGIPEWLEREFIKAVSNAKSLNDVIDFQPIWEKHIREITDNKVVMTLAYFLDGIKFNYNGVTLVWDKRKLVNTREHNFIPAFARKFHFSNYVAPTPISLIRNEVDEDEVTYAIVHNVLIPNGFKIVSVSYPGAQGSMAVLPEPEAGKAQPRTYIDVIAVPPSNSNLDVVLDECKGMFREAEVQRDVEKLLDYKYSARHIKALTETLFVAQVIDGNKQLKNIVVGVSFGVNSQTETRWQIDKVDFIFRIVDRENWAIGIFKQEMRNLIPVIEGKTKFPPLYRVNKELSGTLFS